jgi:uncharacterized protein
MSKESKDRRLDPRAAPVASLCRDGDTLLGAWPLAQLPRLSQSLFDAPAADERVSWQARFGQDTPVGSAPRPWLELEARTHVTLQCQRCLLALQEPLVMQRRFLFVASEAEAERLDADSDDDHLALVPRLDLLSLVEDELILELPLVPRHEGVCPEPLPLAEPGAEPAELRPNPFAALAALRKPGSGGQP